MKLFAFDSGISVPVERLQSLAFFSGWCIGVVWTLLFLIRAYFDISYQGSPQQLRDQVKGIERTFYVTKSLVIALVGWALVFLCH